MHSKRRTERAFRFYVLNIPSEWDRTERGQLYDGSHSDQWQVSKGSSEKSLMLQIVIIVYLMGVKFHVVLIVDRVLGLNSEQVA